MMDKKQQSISGAWYLRPLQGFNALSQVEKAYVIGIGICGIALLLSLIGARHHAGLPALLAALILCSALAREAYVLVVKHLESPLSKWFMVPAAVMVSAYSLGSAANFVNTATGQDPSLFPRAVTFIAPVAAIPVLALFVSLLASISLLVMLFAWGTQRSSKDKKRSSRAWLWLGRMGGAFVTLSLSSTLAVEESSFSRFVEKTAGWPALGLDMHVDRACASDEWDRVLRINDELVLVASKRGDGIIFRRQVCALQAE